MGGSDIILNADSLFTSYTNADTNDIREVLEHPELLGDLHKGACPWYDVERMRRTVSAFREEIMGVDERERKHEKMVIEYMTRPREDR